MKSRAITVGQLNNYIKQIFDAEELLHNIEVVGEVDGLSVRGSAVYFSLRDDGGGGVDSGLLAKRGMSDPAVIQCVCYYPRKLGQVKNGDKVVVRGRVSYWHKAGKINFTVTHIEAFGQGDIFARFKELRAKLEKEGFFDEGRKRTLPQNPRRIGIVTSRQGAVIHDIIKVAHRRNPSLDIVLFPVQVQGRGAEQSISEGLKYFGNQCKVPVDLIILARGGGSAEDLCAFNSELVARAVFESSVPIISAIGHETDWTLVDFVADLRAPTPSVAAEICVPIIQDRRDRAVQLWQTCKNSMHAKLEKVAHTTKSWWYVTHTTTISRVNATHTLAESLLARIDAVNPLAVLRRGFAKVLDANRVEIDGVAGVKAGDKLALRMYNGEIETEVLNVKGGI